MSKQTTLFQLTLEMETYADEQAQNDMSFVGDEALKILIPNPAKRAKIREGMLLIAKMSAGRVVRKLHQQGRLNPDKVKAK